MPFSSLSAQVYGGSRASVGAIVWGEKMPRDESNIETKTWMNINSELLTKLM